MEKSLERTERTYIKLALGIPLGIILLILLCWGGWRGYASWEERHQVRRAVAFIAGGEYTPAMLSARRALQLNPNSTRAMRVMAEVAEHFRERAALDWRRKIWELDPRATEDALALANCAVQFGNTNMAEKALAGIDPGERNTAMFHAAEARLAKARKNSAEAEKQWGEALRLDPNNESYQFQFALSLLEQPNEASRQEAHRILERLRASATYRSEATRSLLLDGLTHRGDPRQLRILAQDLQGYPGASLDDRLVYLNVLRILDDPEYTANLTAIEKDAVAKPEDLAELILWMSANRMSLIAIDFAKSLPQQTLDAWPVPRAMAEAYTKKGDWPALEELTANGNWKQLDFIRRAYLTRALRARDNSVVAEREWAGAVKTAAAQSQSLLLLARTISDWGWENEIVDLLWQLAKYPESQVEALQTLYQHYEKADNTQGLYRVLVRLAEIDPGDLNVQNNLAQISLLLNADPERARKLAADLYAKEPSNAAYVSTYAFSLHTKGDSRNAARIMSGLRDDQLENPSLAAYYGIVLAAAGETTKARKYIEIGRKAHLLSEEKALIDRAEALSK